MSGVLGLLIPVEGPLNWVYIDKLEDLQKAVGGWIQAVPVPEFVGGGETTTAYINEEGKLEGLPFNGRATDFMVPGCGLFWGDYIAGPMLLVGFDPSTGEHTDHLDNRVVRRARLIEREAGL